MSHILRDDRLGQKPTTLLTKLPINSIGFTCVLIFTVTVPVIPTLNAYLGIAYNQSLVKRDSL